MVIVLKSHYGRPSFHESGGDEVAGASNTGDVRTLYNSTTLSNNEV
jgi:hypothetical protein